MLFARPAFIVALPAPVLALVFTFASPCQAATFNEIPMDAQAITQLEQRAELANPREQCFLYTELVHQMTEMAGKQLADGDMDHVNTTLKRAEHYAQLIHLNLARDTKRIKNAEMLMHHTTQRLRECLHFASSDDKVVLQSTLRNLDQVENELLTQVFAH